MTFTISKKDILYGSLICVLLIALGLNYQANSVAAQQESTEKVAEAIVEEDPLANVQPEDRIPTNIQHLSCSSQMFYGQMPYSTVYNDDIEYFTPFMGNGSNFQDINGDGLVDYLYNYHNMFGSNETVKSDYRSCVYLNRGNGWDLAYICLAETQANAVTGQVTGGHYYGDCAVIPSSNDKE